LYSAKIPVKPEDANDQNGRNIIEGSTNDFILGDDIKREYDLRNHLESGFKELFESLATKLKKEYKISTKASSTLGFVSNEDIKKVVPFLANTRDKGKSIDWDDYSNKLSGLDVVNVENEIDENSHKYRRMLDSLANPKSAEYKLFHLSEGDLSVNDSIKTIEENDDAITILTKYNHLDDCVVCDNEGIDKDRLLDEKQKSRERTFNSLCPETKKILEDIVKDLGDDDPFGIKSILIETISDGDFERIDAYRDEFRLLIDLFNCRLSNAFVESLASSGLTGILAEYNDCIQGSPEFSDEDIMFVEKFINSCLEKQISLVRTDGGNLELLLGDETFLNKKRAELGLSNGEQNFISLAFELLKAKAVDSKYIILDDPISSFDSIYKNKIAYSILKFLGGKKQIILTHNLDLVRLLEHQQPNSFNLYILNNVEGENNGFIGITELEQNLILYLHKLVDFFREDVFEYIVNERMFLISMIPFMRGYAQIIGNNEAKEKLTSLMHGYRDESHNVGEIYNEVFGCPMFSDACFVSASDISDATDIEPEIVRMVDLPLLNNTLFHLASYLFLRNRTEKVLVDRYNVNTNRKKMLSQIIGAALNGDSYDVLDKRMFLLSRKTLLNEFNHFEIDLSIFQPAIDITDTALNKEKHDILEFLEEIVSS